MVRQVIRCQRLKREILLVAAGYDSAITLPAEIDASNVDELYELQEEENPDAIQDARSGVREGTDETDLPCDYSRHYESKAVARKLRDGTWVGWTYWFGGGKFGEPDAIDWMPDAYELECTEEEKMVVVREFAKRESP